jgi:carbohydrate binding protein with CBM4/9 domain
MAMDYYEGDIEMGNAAISAAENTLSQGLPRRQRRRGLAHLQRRLREHRPVHQCVHGSRRRNPAAPGRGTLLRYTGAKGSASFTWTISATAPPPNSLANGGFETGSLSPWVCQAGDTVVTAPVHSGTYAAEISATDSQTGECDQTITLSPNTSYTLTGWTEGSYAYAGVSGGATASTWTSSSGWAQQTVSFTTGSSGTITVFVHGWYGQGNVYADDFSVS